MLIKRTNILFEDQMWNELVYLSKLTKRSVGDLIRSAVTKTYKTNSALRERQEAIDFVLKNSKPFNGRIDYKELINRGRKY